MLILVSGVPVTAQEAPSPLSLAQCIDSAMSRGTDSVILEQNLALSREQYSLAVSQSS
jgi:hypothetical protein